MQLKHIFALFALSIFTIACESDFQPPHEITSKGGFVRFDQVLNGSINPSDAASQYEAMLVAPGGNVTSYDINFTFVSASLGSIGPVYMKSVNSFPSNLTITIDEIASAAGIKKEDINPGDRVDIEATVTNSDGLIFTSADFTGDLFNPGERQAMQYSVFFLCPWNESEAVGKYLIVRDDFETTLDIAREIEAVAGPGENEITFKNLFSHPEGYDVTVAVPDPSTAVATVAKQAAWHCDNFGCPYGEGRVEGGGLFFSCSGFLTLTLSHTVDAGGFGDFALDLQKQ